MANRTPIQLPLAIEGASIEILLTRGYITTIDAVDGDLVLFNWYAKPEKTDRFTAARSYKSDGKQITEYLHRVILERKVGRALHACELVDHADRNPLNNRRHNLRIATHSQNRINSIRNSNNSTSYKGVHYMKDRDKWRAEIMSKGNNIFLGYFNTPEEAYEAYKEAAIQIYGEFARFE